MFATRTLTTVAALILTASVASAQLPAPTKPNLPNVNVPNAINPNIQLPPRPNIGLTDQAKERFSRPDLAVTGLRVVAGGKVEVTVANVGRGATKVGVELRVVSSGTGNLDSPAALERFTVRPLPAGQQQVFTTADDKLLRRARESVSGQGVVLVAANVDPNKQVLEDQEANNVLTISTK